MARSRPDLLLFSSIISLCSDHLRCWMGVYSRHVVVDSAFTSIACSMFPRSLCSAQRYLLHLINFTIHAVIQDAKIPGMTTQTRMTLYILSTLFLEVVSIDVQPISLSSRYKKQLHSRRVKIEIGKSTYSPSFFRLRTSFPYPWFLVKRSSLSSK